MGSGKTGSRMRGATTVELSLVVIAMFMMGAAGAKALGHTIAARTSDAQRELGSGATAVVLTKTVHLQAADPTGPARKP